MREMKRLKIYGQNRMATIFMQRLVAYYIQGKELVFDCGSDYADYRFEIGISEADTMGYLRDALARLESGAFEAGLDLRKDVELKDRVWQEV